MIELNVFIAFTGGLVSFFAPCVVPLLPTYVAYIFGVSVRGPTPGSGRVILASIFYLLGFSLIFIFLGAFAATIGGFLRGLDFWLIRIGGIILILFGLEMFGLFYIPFPSIVTNLPSLPFMRNIIAVRSFFLGTVFSLVWTPCVGAVLGSILLLAGSTRNALDGAFLLFVYSLGISLPFLLVAVLLSRSTAVLARLKAATPIISKVAGILLIAMGLLLLTDTFKYLNSWIFEVAFRLGYQVR